MFHRLTLTSALALLASVALAGCSISPEPLRLMEIQTLADNNAARVTANQEPITSAISLHEAT